MSIVESHMSYLEPWLDKKEAPYVRGKVEESFPRTNFVNQEYAVQVHDARPKKVEFDLDVHGFAFHEDQPLSEHIIEAIRSRDKSLVEQEYYPLAVELVKKVTGAGKVIIFDHTYRKRDPALGVHENPNGREQPATVVHCDQGPLGAVKRVHRHAGDDAEALLQGRAQILNVWRPIHGTVQDWPLALMDFRSVKNSEIHPTNIFRERSEIQGQTVSFSHSNEQQWFYLDQQQPTEVTFIKIWDNKEDVAKMCAHCAFPKPGAPVDSPLRESVEVRCLVFH